MIRAAVIYLALVVAGHAAGLDDGRFLATVPVIEGWAGRDGRLGERGPFQFRRITWRQHMPGVSFTLARDPATARVCAVRHLAWLRRELRRAGIDDNAFNCALAWNAGLDRVLSGRAPLAAYDYATRFQNLYRSQ